MGDRRRYWLCSCGRLLRTRWAREKHARLGHVLPETFATRNEVAIIHMQQVQAAATRKAERRARAAASTFQARYGPILTQLKSGGDLSLAEFSKRTGLPLSTIFNRLRRLEKLGKIRRVGWVVVEEK